MAFRECELCGAKYDDLYRWTYCPHDPFQMQSVTTRADGLTRTCHTIEEQDAFLMYKINDVEDFLS